MADMVASAIVQEGISRVISLVLGKRKETAHNTERLEIAVSQLEFAVERTGKFPITERSLLRRRKMLKRAYTEGAVLLDKHKQDHDEMGQGVKRSNIWITCAKNYFVSSSAVLNMDDVRRFEWFADCADKFIRDVESGCSLQHYTFCNPIARHLLEGKTLGYELKQGSQLRHLFMWPIFLEGRGVEMVLSYYYQDWKMPEKTFCLELMLRLSENTDIVGTAIKCLQLLTSQFKLVTETAMGELTLLTDLQDISHLHVSPWDGTHEEHHVVSEDLRPDPVCCKEDGYSPFASNIESLELSHTFPEQVICLSLSLCTSSDEVGTSVMRGANSPLQLSVCFMPHAVNSVPRQENYVLRTIGEHEEFRGVSIQQAVEIARSKTTNHFLNKSSMVWSGNHGSALFSVGKPSTDMTLRTVHPKLRAAVLCRLFFVEEELVLLMKQLGLVKTVKCIRQLVSKLPE